MKSVVRLAIVDPNDTSRAALKNLMLGIDLVWLEAECSRYEFFSDVVTQTRPDLAIVNIDSDRETALALIASVTNEMPDCGVLALSASQEGSLILRAMRNGAREFLAAPPNIDDFLAALDRIRQQSASRDGDGNSRPAEIITVAGVGGGIGCTSLAVNLACALSADPRNSVVLADLDLILGDADVWLDIISDYTIEDVAENITRLDYTLLKRSLTKHACGTFLLPRPAEMGDGAVIEPGDLRRIASLLKSTFTHLVFDIGKSYSALDRAALEVCDSLLLVTQLDLPSLRNVVRLTQYFEQDEALAAKLKIVVNRSGLDGDQISTSRALQTIGRDVFWEIPNDYPTMVESRNNGVPLITLSPKSKLTKSFIELARKFSADMVDGGEDGEASAKKARKLFGFLAAGKGGS